MKCKACKQEMAAYEKPREEFVKEKNEEFENALKDEKEISMRALGGKGTNKFKLRAWTFIPQSYSRHKKVFVIQRFRRVKEEKLPSGHKHRRSAVEYRVGYWIVGKKGNRKNKWTWGQFCPLIPENDIGKIVRALEGLKKKKKGLVGGGR